MAHVRYPLGSGGPKISRCPTVQCAAEGESWAVSLFPLYCCCFYFSHKISVVESQAEQRHPTLPFVAATGPRSRAPKPPRSSGVDTRKREHRRLRRTSTVARASTKRGAGRREVPRVSLARYVQEYLAKITNRHPLLPLIPIHLSHRKTNSGAP
jgi:hypothetical protein